MDNEFQRRLEIAPSFARLACDELTTLIVGEFGGASYIKTIYLGFQIDGQMVAAAYPDPHRLEVALALPEEHEAPGLIDATHLTWRTMPVAYQLSEVARIPELLALAREAAERVRSGDHHVELPTERFIRSRLERKKR